MPAAGHFFFRLLVFGLLPPLPGFAAADPPAVTFETTGGDAWTFEKRVQGTFAPACERIVIHARRDTIEASLDGERFFAEVPLQEGANELSAACTADGRQLARSVSQRWHVRLPDVPKAWIRTQVTDAVIRLDAGRSERAPATPVPVVAYSWRARAGNPAPLVTAPGAVELDRQPAAGEAIDLRAPRVDGDYFVVLRVTDALGRTDESTAMFRVEGGKPRFVDLEDEHPRWVDTAVLYGIAPYFFGDPAFERITDRLDEIAALGASAVWLSPVTPAPRDDFGYAVLDHFRLGDKFGDEQAFRALVARAHSLGLRVLLDFVPNHVSDRHPLFRAAEQQGTRSPYYDWFERDAQGEVIRYFDWTHLKSFDYDNPEVQSYVIAAFAHWVRAYGVDGFRVDASWAIRRRAPEFWPRWREELKRIDPDLLLLAEASARDPYYVDDGFDAAYDWTANLGEWAWNEAFDTPEPDLAALRSALTNGGTGYPPDTLILRFLNNNDTGTRFITRHGAGQARVAAALLFTVPGLPLVYNGDEVGAEFEPYDEGPPIEWRDAHGLLPLYTRLAELRRTVPALAGRALKLVATDQDADVLAYVRPGAAPGQSLLVVLNFSPEPRRVCLLDREVIAPVLAAGQVKDWLTGEELALAAGTAELDLAPFGALVLAGPMRKR